jgi:acyl dehydratase
MLREMNFDVVGFAQLTGDRNPVHLAEHFAARTQFGRRIAHGLYTASCVAWIERSAISRRSFPQTPASPCARSEPAGS